jgi:hypothetical protein
MSEWLTFGQLLDKMQVGDIAESEETHQIHYYLKRGTDGFFYEWMGKHVEDVNYFDRVKLQECHIRCKWRILPRYVSFEEAMKALKEGKRVALYINSYKETFSLDEELDSLTLRDLIEGKWTIEE